MRAARGVADGLALLAGGVNVDVRRLADAHIAGCLQFCQRGFKQAERVVYVLQGNGILADLEHVIHDELAACLFAIDFAAVNIHDLPFPILFQSYRYSWNFTRLVKSAAGLRHSAELDVLLNEINGLGTVA